VRGREEGKWRGGTGIGGLGKKERDGDDRRIGEGEEKMGGRRRERGGEEERESEGMGGMLGRRGIGGGMGYGGNV